MTRKSRASSDGDGSKKQAFDAEEFVKVWQSSDSVKAVADAMKLDPHAASTRAMYFRKKGVPLKNMPRHRGAAYDFEALKEIALKTAEKGS